LNGLNQMACNPTVHNNYSLTNSVLPRQRKKHLFQLLLKFLKKTDSCSPSNRHTICVCSEVNRFPLVNFPSSNYDPDVLGTIYVFQLHLQEELKFPAIASKC